MPPKRKFTKEEVLAAALQITREEGIGAVTTRGLGERLGTSARPIFGLFSGMEEVLQGVIAAADDLYQEYLRQDMAAGKYPAYKASGMAYIRFAREEKQLFRLLFMRNRTHEQIQESREWPQILALIQANTGLTKAEAALFHTEMWVYVHGIAVMLATDYLAWDEAAVSRMLTDGYMGLRARFLERGERDGSHPDS